MSQVSSELFEKNGYADAKKACEILMIGFDRRHLANLRNKYGFQDIITRGWKIGYKISSLEKFKERMNKEGIKL